MIDMLGNEVKVGDKVIYSERFSKKLVLGYFTKEIGPKKGVVDRNPDGLKRYIEVNSTPDWPEDRCYNSYTGEKIVIPGQIFKVE